MVPLHCVVGADGLDDATVMIDSGSGAVGTVGEVRGAVN
jgi:hypothetical protein